jgi:hypothetical protein
MRALNQKLSVGSCIAASGREPKSILIGDDALCLEPRRSRRQSISTCCLADQVR